ncbi:hypothetical protein KZ483_17290 [Paenibacillus sp. sptzw28]|uniref:hypothetical protein n=1 Tax=Paenibacillus sp. sptzw28 TaxID=715179 RepID=UPI001C6F3A3E|nr:hypothetical protein [Paenibacillus sp. sptzw28]QYR19645.1 hypothetical protein KZ483_17290 [Paenibacillus sp. sptzw28]
MDITLKFGSWTIEIDHKKTSEYFNHDIPDDCKCTYCQNYRLHSAFMSNQLMDFFRELGIEPSKEGEFMEFGPNEKGDIHYAGFYHIKGRILEGPRKITEEWNKAELIKIDNFEFGFSSEDIASVPRGFPEPIIQLHFETFIPWRHEEPYK